MASGNLEREKIVEEPLFAAESRECSAPGGERSAKIPENAARVLMLNPVFRWLPCLFCQHPVFRKGKGAAMGHRGPTPRLRPAAKEDCRLERRQDSTYQTLQLLLGALGSHERRCPVGPLLIATCVLLFLWGGFHAALSLYAPDLAPSHSTFALSPQIPALTYDSLLEKQGMFWRSFHKLLREHGPECNPPARPEDSGTSTQLSIDFDSDTNRTRPDLLYMSPADIEQMRQKHASFVDELHTQKYRLEYIRGTRGVVTTAGGPYLPVFLISLRMLRRTGSTLPLEVFLADYQEYDADICDNVLPTLNAKCRVLSDIFQSSEEGAAIGHYQYKIMSILFSSFEQVLFLDSDAFPIYNPESLFTEEPFRSTGMIVWPDYWAMCESPLYFTIAGIPTTSLRERAAAESGELLYAKPSHEKSLMLAAYYNYYGPDFYYLLQSQAGPGEGDKETFPLAATALGESFYNVHKGVGTLGHVRSNGDWKGSAMVQHDPIQDSHIHSSGSKDNPRPFFIHANVPKFDPASVFEPYGMGGPSPARYDDGTYHRAWLDESDAVAFFGFDVERRFWEEIKWTACELERNFTAWQNVPDICARTATYWDDVFGGSAPQT